MIFRKLALAVLAGLVLLAAPRPAWGQEAPRLQSEARVDAITGSAWALHAGLGVTAPLGTYVRFGVVGGVGAGADGMSGRTDLIARFTLDPFRERRWAPYGVGGISARYGESSRTYLLVLAGVEGPIWRGVAPAVEAGFGGSFRAGLILRQAFPRRR